MEHQMSQSEATSDSATTISFVLPKLKRTCVVRSFALSDTGRVRHSNEDHFVIVELARTMSVHQTNVTQAKVQYSSHRGHLFIVADGMGGVYPTECLPLLTDE
jgi:hypothetical protein